MRNDLLFSVTGVECNNDIDPTTPQDVEDAELKLAEADVDDAKEHADLVEDMVSELGATISGMESLLTNQSWDGNTFRKLYAHAGVLSNKLSGTPPDVLGAECFSAQHVAQVEVYAGMEGFGDSVKAGVKKLIEAILTYLKRFFNYVFGIDKKVDDTMKRVSKLLDEIDSQEEAVTVKTSDLSPIYFTKEGDWFVEITGNMKELDRVLVDALKVVKSGNIDVVAETKKILNAVARASEKKIETKVNGEEIFGIVKSSFGNIRVNQPNFSSSKITDEKSALKALRMVELSIAPPYRQNPESVVIGSSMALKKDVRQEMTTLDKFVDQINGGVSVSKDILAQNRKLEDKDVDQVSFAKAVIEIHSKYHGSMMAHIGRLLSSLEHFLGRLQTSSKKEG